MDKIHFREEDEAQVDEEEKLKNITESLMSCYNK
jgi:hypothetical protein